MGAHMKNKKNSKNDQFFTIFAPIYYLSSHPRDKRIPLGFAPPQLVPVLDKKKVYQMKQ
jgi:hypothetical protein